MKIKYDKHFIENLLFYKQHRVIAAKERSHINKLIKGYKASKKRAVLILKKKVAGKETISQARAKAILIEADKMIKALSLALAKSTEPFLKDVANYSFDDTVKILSWNGIIKSPGFENVALTAVQMDALASFTKNDLLDYFEKGLKSDEVEAVQKSLISGVNPKVVSRELFATLEDDKRELRNIETVVRTSVSKINTQAHQSIYEANEDIIKGYEWSAVMENGNVKTGRGTCPECAALDGMIYDTVEESPTIPKHPNCRCMLLPVTKGWGELLGEDLVGKDDVEKAKKIWNERNLEYEVGQIFPSGGGLWPRQKLDSGKVGLDYPEWWTKQNKNFQDNSVGVIRANLIRGNAIEFREMVDKNGDLIKIVDLNISQEQLEKARTR